MESKKTNGQPELKETQQTVDASGGGCAVGEMAEGSEEAPTSSNKEVMGV